MGYLKLLNVNDTSLYQQNLSKFFNVLHHFFNIVAYDKNFSSTSRGNDAGLSVEERALFWKIVSGIRWNQQIQFVISLFHATSVGTRAEVPVKMPPRKNRPLTEAYEQEFEQRVMARIEERLYQFVDQFADRMNDMMNLRRHGDRNGQRSKGEESENLFFKGDGSSLSAKPEEWEYDGVVDDDYEESPVFDDDQFDDDYERPPVFDDDQFEEELEMLDDAFVLIGKEVAPDSKIPEARFHLHKEFCGVFPNELPDRSPPLCDIQRHIDLESSLQFPNMGESEDLRRQVKDLVSKGYVCERMSPCAQPRRPLDLMSLYVSGSVPKKVQDFVEGLHEVHKAVRDNLVRANSKYKQDADQKRRQVDFEVGDFVWAILTKDRFPVGEYNKLSAKKIGPLEIVEKINSNAYRLKLPSHIRCSDVFNVKHLLPYHGDSSHDDLVGNSRTNFVYPWRNDAGLSVEEQALLFLKAQDRVKEKA
ncbi:hypothetical protein Tco_1069171 [Tanacetum coccineum]|uniref:Tf2-1-like SH3-like domain-containing protein n=1 Tax=Tanacetum coccineum TaxID=301880 RepID=A0ABQ5HIX0_9ASTR